MSEKTVVVTCPACAMSKEVPAAQFPPRPVMATCGSCGQAFPFAGHLASPDTAAADFDINPAGSAGVGVAAPVPPAGPAARSSFVTTLAWIFIVLCGFTTAIAVLQNIMLNTIFPIEKIDESLRAPGVPEMPALFRFMFAHFRLYFAAVLVLSAGMLAAAIGLLKRKNWARRLFIAFLAFGIAWSGGDLVLQYFFLHSFPQPAGAPPEFAATFATIQRVMVAFSVLFSLAMATMFGWLIRRLTAVECRQEFGR